MKKGPIIALVIFVVLVALYFVTQNKPTTEVATPLTIEAVAKTFRVEVVKPGDGENLVVLEKKGDVWTLTKPTDAPVEPRTAKQLDEALAKSIRADDLPVPEAKFADYDLTDDKAFKVSIYSEGATSPNIELFLGKDIRVKGTNAQRAYIRTTDGKAYRAQTELGGILRRESSKLRSKVILENDKEAFTELTAIHGEEIVRLNKGVGWALAEPTDVKMDLEMSQVNAMLSHMGNLKAIAFVDGKEDAAFGLAPPAATVTARAGDKLIRVDIGNPEKDKYYAKKPGDPTIYEITKTAGKTLTLGLLDLRNRIEKEIEKEDFEQIAFAGEERVVIEKSGDGWVMKKPKSGPVDDAKLSPRLGTFMKLRANTYHDVTMEEAGLTKPFASIDLKTKQGTFTFLLGKEIDDRGTRYGKWRDSDYIMSVSQFVTDRATAKASELLKDGA